MVHQRRLDRADDHHWKVHRLLQLAHRHPGGDHGRPGRGAVVHQHLQQHDRADHHRREGHQLHRHRHQHPGGDHGRAGRGAVVHQRRQQLDRADHHRRDGHQLHRSRHQRPGGDHGRAGRGAVVHQHGSNSIGRITTAGTVTIYTGTGIASPGGDHGRAGRGAVVHQRRRQRLDRADHHHRDDHHLHRRRHQRPDGITAGPDGALWFTNPTGNDSIGRITTTGTVTSYTSTGIDSPAGSRPGRTGRCGSPTPATARSGGSPPPGRSPATPAPASTARRGSRPARTGRCGSPTPGTTRSGGSPPPGTVTSYTGPGISVPAGDHGRARRGAVVHQHRQQLDRADHHHRDGHQLHRHRHQRPGRDHGRAGRGAVVHQRGNNSIGRITTTGTVTNYTGTSIHEPEGITAGPGRGAVVHQRRRQLDRADHHRRNGHHLHRPRHRRPGGDHGRARTGRCGSPTTAAARSGGSPPPARSPSTTTPVSPDRPTSPLARTGRCGSPTPTPTTPRSARSAGSPPPGRSPSTPPPASTSRSGSRPARTGHCGSPTMRTTRSGGSPPPLPRRPRNTGRPVTPIAGVTASTGG